MQQKMRKSKTEKEDICNILDNINQLQSEILHKSQELVICQLALKKYNCPLYFEGVTATAVKIDIIAIKRWLACN
jgi:hypothetical protein